MEKDRIEMSRRERRACFGELVQADASDHDWLEGRGPRLALAGMIDDATSRVVLRFHRAETTMAYLDVLGRWLRRHGRPLSWYSDRHGIFRAEEKVSGHDEKRSVPTQFSRALSELGVELILAGSPQAKGRIERLWGTCQDRLVKELRLAGAKTIEEANEVLARFEGWFNRHKACRPSSGNDAHRPLDGLDLKAIPCLQESRVVANDYTIHLDGRVFQLQPPAWPGLRGGRVIVERRSDGELKLRFEGRYLAFSEVRSSKPGSDLGALPPGPRSLSPGLVPVSGPALQANGPMASSTGPLTVHQVGGRSGCTPAAPCPPADGLSGKSKRRWRPASDHPWRRSACV